MELSFNLKTGQQGVQVDTINDEWVLNDPTYGLMILKGTVSPFKIVEAYSGITQDIIDRLNVLLPKYTEDIQIECRYTFNNAGLMMERFYTFTFSMWG